MAGSTPAAFSDPRNHSLNELTNLPKFAIPEADSMSEDEEDPNHTTSIATATTEAKAADVTANATTTTTTSADTTTTTTTTTSSSTSTSSTTTTTTTATSSSSISNDHGNSINSTGTSDPDYQEQTIPGFSEPTEVRLTKREDGIWEGDGFLLPFYLRLILPPGFLNTFTVIDLGQYPQTAKNYAKVENFSNLACSITEAPNSCTFLCYLHELLWNKIITPDMIQVLQTCLHAEGYADFRAALESREKVPNIFGIIHELFEKVFPEQMKKVITNVFHLDKTTNLCRPIQQTQGLSDSKTKKKKSAYYIVINLIMIGDHMVIAHHANSNKPVQMNSPTKKTTVRGPIGTTNTYGLRPSKPVNYAVDLEDGDHTHGLENDRL